MWGVYPGSKKKKSERYCCVGKHGPSEGYFERVPPGLTHLYRPRDGEFWCCDMHWDPPDIASDVETPAKRTRRSSSASHLRTPMATTPSKSQSTSDFITPTKKIRRSPSSAVLDTPLQPLPTYHHPVPHPPSKIHMVRVPHALHGVGSGWFQQGTICIIFAIICASASLGFQW